MSTAIRIGMAVSATLLASLPATAAASSGSAWTRVGPPAGLAAPRDLVSRGGSVLATFVADQWRASPTSPFDEPVTMSFLSIGPDGTRTGRLPTLGQVGTPVVVGPRTFVIPFVGVDGQQLLRTTDGGSSWRAIRAPSCSTAIVFPVSVAFSDDGHGILVGGGALGDDATSCVWATDDAGARWRLVSRGPQLQAPAALGGDRYLAVDARSGSATLRRSADGGATWSDVPLPPVPRSEALPTDPLRPAPVPAPPLATDVSDRVILVGPGGHVVLGGSFGGLLESTDGGRSFVRREMPSTDGPPRATDRAEPVALLPDGSTLLRHYENATSTIRMLLARSDGTIAPAPAPFATVPGAAAVGATGDQRAAFATTRTPGGRTSLLATSAARPAPETLAAGRTEPGNRGTAGLAAYLRDGQLWLSRDGGARWTTLTPPVGVRPRAVAPTSGGALVLGSDGRLWRVVSGSWRPAGRVPGGQRLVRFGSTIVVAGEHGISRLVGGRRAAVSGVGTTTRTAFLVGSRRLLVAVTRAGRVTRSHDGGRHWTPGARIGGRRMLAVASGGRRAVVAVGDRRLWVSNDGGRRFRRGAVLPGPGPEGWSGDQPSIVLDGRRGAIAAYGRLWRTDDGGRSVTRASLPPHTGVVSVSRGRGSRLLVQDDVSGDLLRSGPRR